jgi:murein DD-endopeptidase MepM/ murein hydrolase activator NlpD
LTGRVLVERREIGYAAGMLEQLASRIPSYRRSSRPAPLPALPDRFGIRSLTQLARDYAEMLREGLRGQRFQFDLRSAGLFRPDLSLPAYAGFEPSDGLAPVCTLFDRVGGAQRYTQRVSRRFARDFRGGRLSYDEHDGTDMVCPVGTVLTAAAPGVVVLVRDRFLRGGLTIAVDHGHGVVTQYTHCAEPLAAVGTQVARGQPVARSGAAGLDMVQFFPLIPPHVHFMVYVSGVPVDPFLARGEARRAGVWRDPAEPQTSGPLVGDADRVQTSPVDEDALERAVRACNDARIRAEIYRAEREPAQLAALLEDALVHDAWAFPGHARESLRRADASELAFSVELTLPFLAEQYRGLRIADAPWTTPARA